MKPAAFLLLALLCLPAFAQPDPLAETRYCGPPARDAEGRIARRMDVVAAFRSLYPCPSTWEYAGACPAWAVDHVIPLAVGGCDAVSNLQWLPLNLKSCTGACKDRWERDVYKRRPP